MTAAHVYALLGVLLFCLGLYGFWAHRHLLRRILAINITGSGTFLTLIALAQRAPDRLPDPVPHALVLTGIVIAVSATALALLLFRRLFALTGRAALEEDATAEDRTRSPMP